MSARQLARVTAAAACVAAASGASAYRVYGGYIPAGGDVSTLPPGTTTADAEQACDAAAGCVGFTFDGPRRGPAPGNVYLKNSTAGAEFVPDPASNWTTFLRVEGPCDILLAAGAPCVAAHSVARALYGAYAGSLYQVRRASDNETLDVGTVPDSGALADAAAQDAFCGAAACVISRIYDQSPSGNHLDVAPQNSRRGTGFDLPVNASRFRTTANGFPIFAAFFEGGMGYRNDNTTAMAKGNDPEVIYYVVDGSHFNDGCCCA